MAGEATESTGFQIHPMDQFVITPLFGEGPVEWYTITNQTLWMFIAILAITALMVLGTSRRTIIPSRIQSVAELIYGFIYKTVEDVSGRDGVKYFPYIITLFLFILFSNMLGLIPMSFTVTSHIAITIVLALLVFLGVTILGFWRNGIGFLGMFWVKSAPLPIRPLLAMIEVISYFVRPVSHSLRLAGNLLAGHALIKVIAGFASLAIISPVVVGGVVAVYGLELLVAVVQAYVFTILTCVYLRDAVGGAHH
jgi:F-type H+-transporting ATPase subunit a